MQSYETKYLALEDLLLDKDNPRFIVPQNATQQNIIDYLIEFEEVEKLAISINKTKNLYPGERIIAVQENDKYIVLEGNRRVCACKILKNTALLQNKRAATISELNVNDTTLANISYLNVDIVHNRLKAQSAMAAKHVDGIKKWSTISKYKFIANEFENGKTLDEIQILMALNKNKITTGLREYNLIKYTLNLDKWTEEDKSSFLNVHELKTTRYTRLFSAKVPDNKPRLREVLKLDYDKMYNPISKLHKDVFDTCLYIIAKAAFDPTYCTNFAGTRGTYLDIQPLLDFLSQNSIEPFNKEPKSKNESGNRTNLNLQDVKENNDRSNQSNETDNENLNQGNSNNTESPSQPQNNDNKTKEKNKSKTSYRAISTYSPVRNNLVPQEFKCDCSSTRISNIIEELKSLNLNHFANAGAVLLRVLIELSAKYYLDKTDNSAKIKENDLRTTVNNALGVMREKKVISNAEHSNLIHLGNKEYSFNIFNGFVHYNSVVPSKDLIVNFFDNYRVFLEICLSIK